MKKTKTINANTSIWRDRDGYRVKQNEEYLDGVFASEQDAIDYISDSTTVLDPGLVVMRPSKTVD